jgi:methyl-accepting chemotaxis protein/ligand-binding sensor domain-containing protein
MRERSLLRRCTVSISHRVAATSLAGLLAVLPAVSARAQELRFRQLTPDNGLSSSYVQYIVQDKQGFLWFGTDKGLDRYDGYSVHNYHHRRTDPRSIGDGNILTIHQDRRDTLWVGTNTGLSRYDRERDAFANYALGSASRQVRAIADDSHGTLWLGTDKGLYRFDRATGTATLLDGSVGTTLAGLTIQALTEDSHQRLWIGTETAGLFMLDAAHSTIRNYSHSAQDPHSLPDNDIRSLIEGAEGALWIGTWNGGLVKLNPETGAIATYQHDAADARTIGANRLVRLAAAGQRGLWIGTENVGLDYFDFASESFRHYRSDPMNPQSLNGQSVWAVHQDDAGALWVGTFTGGVNMATPNSGAIRHFHTVAGDQSSLSNNTVRAFAESHPGSYWVATDGGGLNEFDASTGKFVRYTSKNSNLNSDAVLDVVLDHDGTAWIGAWDGGISRFDRATKSFTSYTTKNTNLGDDNVFALHVDGAGELWLGTQKHGVYVFDRSRKTFVQKVSAQQLVGALPSTETSVAVRVISGSPDGRHLLIGTERSGLADYEVSTGTVTMRQSIGADSTSLSDNTVRAAVEADHGIVWIGTASGLDRFDRNTNTLTHYGESDGLPSGYIAGLAVDPAGNLWISTDRGLVRFDVTAKRVKRYTTADGLQGSEFNAHAYFQGKDGTLLFGGNNGFNLVHPDQIAQNDRKPPVVLTGFQLFNKDVPVGAKDSPLEKHVSQTDRLVLSYKQSVMTFEFAALDYTASEQNQYAYMLEGFDSQWQQVGSQRTASYTNLAPGNYTFRVKASNNDGVWNEQGASIRLKITPPFWKTWWFRLLLLGALVAAVREWLRRAEERREALKREKEYLERSVGEILRSMDKLSEGDLTVQLPVKNDDEIGLLCQGFNKVVVDIRTMVGQVNDALAATVAASQEIHASTEALSVGAEDQTNQALEVATAAEQMSASAAETARHLAIAAEIATKSGEEAQQGGRIARDTTEGMNLIVTVVKNSSDAVQKLGLSSDEISKITRVIEQIADQSELLALNAAIEAARAGAHGRGFGVVADEVRSLAESTAKATRDIARMIQQIQKETKQVVETMDEVTGKVKSGNELVSRAGAALGVIIANSDKVLDRIRQVAAAGEEHAATSAQISETIERISTVTRNAASGTTSIVRAAEHLNRLVELTQTHVTRFRVEEQRPAPVSVVSEAHAPSLPSPNDEPTTEADPTESEPLSVESSAAI